MDRLTKLIVSFFYIGEIPLIPGTFGSLAGLLLYVGLSDSPAVAGFLFALIFLLGFFCAGRAEKIYGKKDPKEVVIDEVAGIFVVFFLIPLHAVSLAAGFILYRRFDVIKPYPARRIERYAGGWGIMFDDIVAGLYAHLILRVFLAFMQFS